MSGLTPARRAALCILQVGGRETFGEPVVDWRERCSPWDADQGATAEAGEYMISLDRYVFSALKP